MVAEEALSNWCKAMGALGQIYMGEFRTDCAAYIVKHNKKFQLRLNEQQFLDLFRGGILKLDKLNMAWHTKSSPSRKPRLKGAFSGQSMVSDTFNELIECGLRKLTRDLEDRSQTIFGEIPILFACAENASAPPAPSGGSPSGGGAQLDMRLPPAPANVTQGTRLQLGGAGKAGDWPRSAMSPLSTYGPNPQEWVDRCAQQNRETASVQIPPEPRFAEILHKNDLMSAADIRSLGVVALFKSEPLLAGKCAALQTADEGRRSHLPRLPVLQGAAEHRHLRSLVGAPTPTVHGLCDCSLAPGHATGTLGLGGQRSVGAKPAR